MVHKKPDDGLSSTLALLNGLVSSVENERTSLRSFDVANLGELVYESVSDGSADIVVVIPLYNYASVIEECIESVIDQDLDRMAIVVIDDHSADEGGCIAEEMLRANAKRFTRARIIRHVRNQGLSMSRNSGVVWSAEPFIFMLDADNRIRRPALTRLFAAIKQSSATFAYSQLYQFGDVEGIGAADIWDPKRLRLGNYIDAMALIRRAAIMQAGGYGVLADDHGWEDYDLWCRFAELGLQGVFLPELLCEYRVHKTSMLRTRTNFNADSLYAEMRLRHPKLFNDGEN